VRIVNASPFAAADSLAKTAMGCPEDEKAHDLRLAFWRTRQPGSRLAEDRYRWEISHKRSPVAGHVPPPDTWRSFRPDLDNKFPELALSLPLSIAETCEYLAWLAEKDAVARGLLDEAAPIFRRDIAQFVLGMHPWIDTFALFAIVRRPRTLERLRPLTLAIATSYAAAAQDGCVRGIRFPFADRPLVSATAHLANGLLVLGAELGLLAPLVDFVRSSRRPNGAFGDETPDDLLTTFACTELLARLDPAFDAEPSVRWMTGQAREDGLFRVLGPEGPWLTAQITSLLEDCSRPFRARFRFPHAPHANLDRKTGVPFFAYFDDVASLFGALEGLAKNEVELAFLDLAGFRAFNNAHGQDAGDAVLAEIATALREELEDAAVVRDGGDEYLVVGAPTRTGLAEDLDAFRARWPERFRKRFPGADIVSARILVGKARGSELRALRERLGKALAPLKHRDAPGPEGLLVRV
jgi:diguanylate cyclase (GGDEF)-like protein